MTNEEKKALDSFSALMRETTASSTIKAKGAGKPKDSNASDNKSTHTKIKANSSAKNAVDPKTHKTSKKDSESGHMEAPDNKKTRKGLEKSNDKKVKLPVGEGRTLTMEEMIAGMASAPVLTEGDE